MAEENVLQLMVQLCLAGRETRYSIEECTGRDTKKQYLTVAMLSRSELRNGDFSCLDAFYKALHLHSTSMVDEEDHPLAFCHGRVTVVLNKCEKNESGTFYEHGERRLFDPEKRLLYQLIDEHAPQSNTLTDTQAERTVLDHTLTRMIRKYRNTGATLDDVVLLVYSYYIPCNLPGHHCAKLLRRYADETGYTFYIAYTDDIQFTKRNEVQNMLNGEKITLFGRQKFERALNDHEVQEFHDFLNKKETNRYFKRQLKRFRGNENKLFGGQEFETAFNDYEVEGFNKLQRFSGHLRQLNKKESNSYIKRQLKRFRGNEKKQEMIKERIEKMFLRHIYTASENKRKKTKVRQNKEMI